MGDGFYFTAEELNRQAALSNPDYWEDHGIFKRNIYTGDLTLLPKYGALGGIADVALNKWSVADNNMFLTDQGINQQLFAPETVDFKNYLSKLYHNTLGMQQQTWGGRILGGTEAFQDITDSIKEEIVRAVTGDETYEAPDAFEDAFGVSLSELRDASANEARHHMAVPYDKGAFANLLDGNISAFFDQAALNMVNAGVDFALTAGLGKVANISAGWLGAAEGSALTKMAPEIVGTIYAADTGSNVFLQTRDGGAGLMSAMGLATTAALGSFWLERAGYLKIFEEPIPGQKWITGVMRGAMGEASTEMAQQPLESISIKLGTGEPINPQEELYNAIDAGIIGFGVGAHMNAITHRVVDANAHKERGSVLWSTLSEKDKKNAMRDYGKLRMALTVLQDGGLGLAPDQISALQAFNRRWGHIDTIHQSLGETIKEALDQKKLTARAVDSVVSDVQVYDEKYGESLTTDKATNKEIITDPDHAEEVIGTQMELTQPGDVKKAADSKITAMEFLLDMGNMPDFQTMERWAEAIMPLFTQDFVGALSPTQRSRLYTIFDRVSRTALDPQTKQQTAEVAAYIKESARKRALAIEKDAYAMIEGFGDVLHSDNADPAVIYKQAVDTVDALYNRTGSTMTDRIQEIIKDQVDTLLNRADIVALERADDPGSPEIEAQLRAAATKLASLLNPEHVNLRRFRPVTSMEFVEDIRRASDNAYTNLRGRVQAVHALLRAVVGEAAGIYPFPKEYQEGLDAGKTHREMTEKAKKEAELYIRHTALGVKGMSDKDVLGMAQDEKLQEAVLEKAASILTPQELETARAVLRGDKNADPRAIDWDAIRQRVELLAGQMSKDYAAERARLLLAAGHINPATLAMSTRDDKSAQHGKLRAVKEARAFHLKALDALNTKIRRINAELKTLEADKKHWQKIKENRALRMAERYTAAEQAEAKANLAEIMEEEQRLKDDLKLENQQRAELLGTWNDEFGEMHDEVWELMGELADPDLRVVTNAKKKLVLDEGKTLLAHLIGRISRPEDITYLLARSGLMQQPRVDETTLATTHTAVTQGKRMEAAEAMADAMPGRSAFVQGTQEGPAPPPMVSDSDPTAPKRLYGPLAHALEQNHGSPDRLPKEAAILEIVQHYPNLPALETGKRTVWTQEKAEGILREELHEDKVRSPRAKMIWLINKVDALQWMLQNRAVSPEMLMEFDKHVLDIVVDPEMRAQSEGSMDYGKVMERIASLYGRVAMHNLRENAQQGMDLDERIEQAISTFWWAVFRGESPLSDIDPDAMAIAETLVTPDRVMVDLRTKKADGDRLKTEFYGLGSYQDVIPGLSHERGLLLLQAALRAHSSGKWEGLSREEIKAAKMIMSRMAWNLVSKVTRGTIEDEGLQAALTEAGLMVGEGHGGELKQSNLDLMRQMIDQKRVQQMTRRLFVHASNGEAERAQVISFLKQCMESQMDVSQRNPNLFQIDMYLADRRSFFSPKAVAERIAKLFPGVVDITEDLVMDVIHNPHSHQYRMALDPVRMAENGNLSDDERAQARRLVEQHDQALEFARNTHALMKATGYIVPWLDPEQESALGIEISSTEIDPKYAAPGTTRTYANQLQAVETMLSTASNIAKGLGQSATPAGFAYTMLASGFHPTAITDSLALVDALAQTFAKRTGRPIAEFYEHSVGFVKQLNAVARNEDGSIMAKPNTDTKEKVEGRAWSWAGTSDASIIGLRNLDDVAKWDSFTFVHELVHNMASNGVLFEMLEEGERQILENWLSDRTGQKFRLPFFDEKGKLHGEKPSKKAQELLVSGVHRTLAEHEVGGPENLKLRDAFSRIREGLLRYLANCFGHGANYITKDVAVKNPESETPEGGVASISGQSYSEGVVPAEVQQVILGLFGAGNARRVYSISNHTVTAMVRGAMRDGTLREIGVDITPLLELPTGLDEAAEGTHRHNLFQTVLDNFREEAPHHLDEFLEKQGETGFDYAVWFAKTFGVESWKDSDNTVRRHDPMFVQKVKQAHATWLQRAKDQGRVTTDMAADDLQPVNPKVSPEERDAVKLLTERTLPLRNEDSTLVKALDDLIGATKLEIFGTHDPDNPSAPPSNRKVTGAVLNFLRSMGDRWGNLWESKTYDLEEALLKLGLTSEYLTVHNLGGLYAQAGAIIEQGVYVDDGFTQRKVNEGLEEILREMPQEMQDDLWRYMAARRQIEIADNHAKRLADYARKLREHEANPDLPRPEKPKGLKLSLRATEASQLVKTFIELKYGKDGGLIGEYAKRVVAFSHAAILDKLAHYGLISNEEVDAMKQSGQWWIPMDKLKDTIEDSGAAPLLQDGTREAMSALKMDMGEGIEHPLYTIQKRVIAAHLYATRQNIRSKLLSALMRDEGGRPLPDRELAKLGLERLTATRERQVTYEEWVRLPREQRSQKVARVPDKDVEQWHGAELSGGEKKVTTRNKPIFTQIIHDAPVARDNFRDVASRMPDDKKQKVFAVWENGNAEYYVVHDDELRNMLESVRPEQLKGAMGFFKKALNFVGSITRFMGASITHSAQFIANMLGRDLQNAFSKSRAGMTIFDLPKAIFNALPALIPNLAIEFPNTFKLWNERRSSLAQQTSLADQFAPEASATHFRIDPTGVYKPLGGGASTGKRVWHAFKQNFDSYYRQARPYRIKEAMGKSLAFHEKAWNILRGTFDPKRGTLIRFTGNVAGLMDAAPRLAEREQLKKGNIGLWHRIKNQKHMAKYMDIESKQWKYHHGYVDMLDRLLTLDFARRGEAVSTLSKLYMFMGPTFQDWKQHKNLFADPTTRRNLIMKSVLAFTLPALANWARWHDDDEWQNLSYWDKFNYIHLFKRDDHTFAKYSWGIGLLSSLFKDLPIAIAQTLKDHDPLAHTEWLGQFVDQTPLQYMPGPWHHDARTMAHNIAPTIAQPTFDVAMNYDSFTRAPIDYDAGKVNTQLAEERGKDRAGIIEYSLAKSGILNLSTRQWAYIMRKQIPGVAGDFVYAPLNKGLTMAYNATDPESTVGEDYKLKEQLFRFRTGPTYGTGSLPVNRLFEMHQKATQAKESWEKEMQLGHLRKADAILRAHPEIEYQSLFKSVYGRVVQMKIERGKYMNQAKGREEVEDAKAVAMDTWDIPMTLLAQEAMNAYWEEMGLTGGRKVSGE